MKADPEMLNWLLADYDRPEDLKGEEQTSDPRREAIQKYMQEQGDQSRMQVFLGPGGPQDVVSEFDKLYGRTLPPMSEEDFRERRQHGMAEEQVEDFHDLLDTYMRFRETPR
jgi:hypothetical protein